MFRIRRVYDDLTPANRAALASVAAILRAQFAGLSAAGIARIPELLRDPLGHGFRAVLYLAEGPRGEVQGFALMSYDSARGPWPAPPTRRPSPRVGTTRPTSSSTASALPSSCGATGCAR